MNHERIWAGIFFIISLMAACRPVFAIGWGEILIFTLVVILLIGPPLYRFFRTFERYRNKKGK